MISKISEVNYYIKTNKFKKIAIIAGKKSFNKIDGKKIIKEIIRKTKTEDVRYFFKINNYPEIKELKKLINFLESFQPNLILALGGGSVIDYAKIANVKNIGNNLVKKIYGGLHIGKEKIAKMVAIPTTAGSGAEVTSGAVIYINKIKYSIDDKIIIPDKHFLLPKIIMKNKKKLKASSGFDAISQSVESIISLKSNNTSLLYAKKSLNISLDNYLSFLKKPNFYNSSNMSIAAMLAGRAINISKTTAPHAVSYPFTSNFNISHGHAVSLTLEKFLKFNYRNQNKSKTSFDLNNRYRILFKIFGVRNIDDLNLKIKNIKYQANLNDDFKRLNIDIKKHYPKILNEINIKRLKNNPIELNKSDIKLILLNNYNDE
tara:strand:- start:10723 stop:11844 length:1122 start_codon:yes stop_codon:yes gene_type:complete